MGFQTPKEGRKSVPVEVGMEVPLPLRQCWDSGLLTWLRLPVPTASLRQLRPPEAFPAPTRESRGPRVQSMSRAQGRLWLRFILKSSSLPASLWPLRRMRALRVFYDCASFYYQQEGSFCNLCMKFMSFPGERGAG